MSPRHPWDESYLSTPGAPARGLAVLSTRTREDLLRELLARELRDSPTETEREVLTELLREMDTDADGILRRMDRK